MKNGAGRARSQKRKNPKWYRTLSLISGAVVMVLTVITRFLIRKDVVAAVEDDENVKLLLVKSKATKHIENTKSAENS